MQRIFTALNTNIRHCIHTMSHTVSSTTDIKTALQYISQHKLPILNTLHTYNEFNTLPRIYNTFCIPIDVLFNKPFTTPDRDVQYSVILYKPYIEQYHKFISIMQWVPKYIFCIETNDTNTIELQSNQHKTIEHNNTVNIDTINMLYIQSYQQFIDIAQTLNMVDTTVLTQPPIAFQSCILLRKYINLIESTLLQAYSDNIEHITLQCLDIGCGSGRDAMWLAATRPTASHTNNTIITCSQAYNTSYMVLHTNYSWTVTCIDNDNKALQRVNEYAPLINIAERIHTIYATIKDGQIRQYTDIIADNTADTNNNNTTINIDKQLLLQDYDNLSPKQKRRYKAMQKQLQQHTTTTKQHTDITPTLHNTHDMILCVRFLERSIYTVYHKLLKPYGLLCIQTFVQCTQYELVHPTDPNRVLQEHELCGVFNSDNGWKILVDDIVLLCDGRPVNIFIAQKL